MTLCGDIQIFDENLYGGRFRYFGILHKGRPFARETTVDVCERVRVCDEEMVLIRFQSESHIIRSENEREMWVSVRKFTSDQDTENFLIELLQIVNPKIFSRSAIKCLRNIFLQKLNDAPRRVFSQYGWCNVNDRNFYFKGVEIDDMEEVPTHWKATTCKEMMERGEAVQIMQNALERNVFLQTELSCVLLISMVSLSILHFYIVKFILSSSSNSLCSLLELEVYMQFVHTFFTNIRN